jgi:hypothetical protein
MKPSHVELPKTVEPRPAQKKTRFRIVKLEERIALNKGGHPNTGMKTYSCHSRSGY